MIITGDNMIALVKPYEIRIFLLCSYIIALIL